MTIEILFEDQDIAVINKPAGTVVNLADTNREESIQEWWSQRLLGKKDASTDWHSLVPETFLSDYGDPETIFAERGGIVHRLDKETSGVMILAKNPGVLVNLLAQFKTRTVQKKYICLVHGKFQVVSGSLEMPIARSRENRLRYTVDAEGRPAVTEYQVVRFYPHLDVLAAVTSIHLNFPDADVPKPLNRKLLQTYQGFSLVECQPKTGRTHQIRVHMSHLKHPVVGDPVYLGHKREQLDRLWCPRLFLHAQNVIFAHPRTGQQVEWSTPLPAELEHVLTFLQHE